MNPFSSHKTNENGQKAPEKRLSADATSILLNNIRPKDQSGKFALQNAVRAMLPKEFMPRATNQAFAYHQEQPVEQAPPLVPTETPQTTFAESPEVVQARQAVQDVLRANEASSELQNA